jgi:hypothetical protein
LPKDFQNGIDAALNGMFDSNAPYAFLFKGKRYIFYDWHDDTCVKSGLISEWNLPWDFCQGIDAAVNAPANYGYGTKYLRNAWFFKGRQYVRYVWGKNRIEPWRNTLLEWDFEKKRREIVAKARAQLSTPEIHAQKLGPDGLRMGWEKLDAIFKVADPETVKKSVPPWPWDARLKKSVKVGNSDDAIPDWCGIYDLWAIKAAVPTQAPGTWTHKKEGGALVDAGLKQLAPDFSLLDVGDVVVAQADPYHHVMITGIAHHNSIDTISGNSGADSTITETKATSIANYQGGWFSAFDPAKESTYECGR